MKYKLSDILLNERNPRYIKDENFKNLVNSIISFPKMMQLRPIVIDNNNISLGGNMRYNACLEINKLGIDEVRERLSEVIKNRSGEITDDDYEYINGNLALLKSLFSGYFPEGWIRKAENLTEQERRAFVLKDNSSFGDWDFDTLANEFEEWELNESEIWTPISVSDNLDDDNDTEIDLDDFSDEVVMKFKFSKNEYELVKEKLLEKGSTIEEGLKMLLEIENE